MFITNQDLIGTDFKIIQTFEKVNLSFPEVLDDMTENLYSQLENHYKAHFSFIKFKDEAIIIQNSDKETFVVFGKYENSLFAHNQKQEIVLIDLSEVKKTEPMFINSSLAQFVRCYCFLLSVFFYANAQNLDENQSKKLAENFKKDLQTIDEKALESLFYQNHLYFIENNELPTHFHPIHYVKSGRHQLPN